MHQRLNLSYLETILVHPTRHQSVVGKLHSTFSFNSDGSDKYPLWFFVEIFWPNFLSFLIVLKNSEVVGWRKLMEVFSGCRCNLGLTFVAGAGSLVQRGV